MVVIHDNWQAIHIKHDAGDGQFSVLHEAHAFMCVCIMPYSVFGNQVDSQ